MVQSDSAILSQLVIRSDRHEGSLLELMFRDRLPAYLGRFLRKGRSDSRRMDVAGGGNPWPFPSKPDAPARESGPHFRLMDRVFPCLRCGLR
jgi:hypothetical protein